MGQGGLFTLQGTENHRLKSALGRDMLVPRVVWSISTGIFFWQGGFFFFVTVWPDAGFVGWFTLSPIIMEMENYPKWKEIHFGSFFFGGLFQGSLVYPFGGMKHYKCMIFFRISPKIVRCFGLEIRWPLCLTGCQFCWVFLLRWQTSFGCSWQGLNLRRGRVQGGPRIQL